MPVQTSPPMSPPALWRAVALAGQSCQGKNVVPDPLSSLFLFMFVSREKQSKRGNVFFLVCGFLEMFFIKMMIVA